MTQDATAYYQQKFEQETGKKAWLPTYSEKYQEDREYLNPEYCEWFHKYMEALIQKAQNFIDEQKNNKAHSA